MNMIFRITIVTLILFSVLLSQPVFAEESSGNGDPPGTNYYGLLGGVDSEIVGIPIYNTNKPSASEVLAISNKEEFFRSIFNLVLGFIGMVAMIMILMGGYYYITAQGEDGQIDKAKKMIIAAIIGMLVVIASYTIVATVVGLGAEAGNPFTDFFKSFFS